MGDGFLEIEKIPTKILILNQIWLNIYKGSPHSPLIFLKLYWAAPDSPHMLCSLIRPSSRYIRIAGLAT